MSQLLLTLHIAFNFFFFGLHEIIKSKIIYENIYIIYRIMELFNFLLVAFYSKMESCFHYIILFY